MVPNEVKNVSNTELYFQMAGLRNECELHKNNFSKKTLELATVLEFAGQRNVQYEKIFLHAVSGEVLIFSELCRYFQTPKDDDPDKIWGLHFWSETTMRFEMSGLLVSASAGDDLLHDTET